MKKNVLIAFAIVLLMCIAAYASLFVAPTESKMGTIQRIFLSPSHVWAWWLFSPSSYVLSEI